MKRILALLAASLLFTAPAAAQRHGEATVLKIWDNRTAPHSNGIASPSGSPNRTGSRTSRLPSFTYSRPTASATGGWPW